MLQEEPPASKPEIQKRFDEIGRMSLLYRGERCGASNRTTKQVIYSLSANPPLSAVANAEAWRNYLEVEYRSHRGLLHSVYSKNPTAPSQIGPLH
ncbi:MAG: hypothetical protein ACFFD2_10935 [Promethearchaeota archaeon]